MSTSPPNFPTISSLVGPNSTVIVYYPEPLNCPDPEHRAILIIYILLVTFLNLLLMYFIRNKTVANMQDYKLVLYTTTIIDFTSAWLQFLIGIVRIFKS